MATGDLGMNKPTAKAKATRAAKVAKVGPSISDTSGASASSAIPDATAQTASDSTTPTADEKLILDNLNEHSFARNEKGKEKLKLFIRVAWPNLWQKHYGEKISTMTIDDRTFGWESLSIKVIVFFEKDEKYKALTPLAWRDAVYEEICRVSPSKNTLKAVSEEFVKKAVRLAKQSLPTW